MTFAFDTLEPRLLLSNVFWNTDQSGSWDTAGNWIDDHPDQLPARTVSGFDVATYREPFSIAA